MSRAETSPSAEAVLTFLESAGHRSEAEHYLEVFRDLPRESFAIIGVESAVVGHALDSIGEQLRFLAELGLVAPIVVGLFDPAGSERAAQRLARRLPRLGVAIERVEPVSAATAGGLRSLLVAGRFPLLRFGAELPAEDRFDRLAEIAVALGSRKLVLCRRRGGLGPRVERSIELLPGHLVDASAGGLSVINLRADRVALEASRLLHREDAALLGHLARFLDRAAPRPLVVNVAAPFDLLKELFTVRGAGTLVKAGAEIERCSGWAAVDAPRVRALIEASFGRPLRSDYFERAPLAVYLERAYRGVAVVEEGRVAPYLAKFAVEPFARGEGLGADLWLALTREHPTLFWRTRADNPVATWYQSVCHGMQRGARWHVYWRGLPPTAIEQAIEEAIALPDDFLLAPGAA
ncbi:MAG: hypothetical protein IT376_11120 [Polyangiaceae bacterium]|nr:hypothetical protein [Polyangiaceae bacterium]